VKNKRDSPIFLQNTLIEKYAHTAKPSKRSPDGLLMNPITQEQIDKIIK